MADPIWNIAMQPFDKFLSYFASWLSLNIKDRQLRLKTSKQKLFHLEHIIIILEKCKTL